MCLPGEFKIGFFFFTRKAKIVFCCRYTLIEFNEIEEGWGVDKWCLFGVEHTRHSLDPTCNLHSWT